MTRSTRPPASPLQTDARPAPLPLQTDFDLVVGFIDAALARAIAAVNTELIDLYWNIGEYISIKITDDGWGKGTVEALATYIQHRKPGMTGFSASNLWRIWQFHETYRASPKLAPLVRELSWTNNLLILSRSKREEEREFYLRVCTREKWGKRELERQLAGALFERSCLTPLILVAPAHHETDFSPVMPTSWAQTKQPSAYLDRPSLSAFPASLLWRG